MVRIVVDKQKRLYSTPDSRHNSQLCGCCGDGAPRLYSHRERQLRCCGHVHRLFASFARFCDDAFSRCSGKEENKALAFNSYCRFAGYDPRSPPQPDDVLVRAARDAVSALYRSDAHRRRVGSLILRLQ